MAAQATRSGGRSGLAAVLQRPFANRPAPSGQPAGPDAAPAAATGAPPSPTPPLARRAPAPPAEPEATGAPAITPPPGVHGVQTLLARDARRPANTPPPVLPTVGDADHATAAGHQPQALAGLRADTGYDDMVGVVLGKRYRVISVLTQGTGTLLLATDIKRGNLLLIRPGSDDISQRGAVRSGFTVNGQPYYVNHFGIAGLTLRNFLGMVGTLPSQQVIDYGLRLCAAARKRPGLLGQRFWSPEAIKIDDTGQLVLAAEPDSIDVQPRPGPFSPPEQAAGGPLDARSDVYLIGAICFFLATGSVPPRADRLPPPRPHLDAKGRPIAGEVEAVLRDFPQVPMLLAGVLVTALQADPAARYSMIDRLAAALRRLVQIASGTSGALPGERIVETRALVNDRAPGAADPLDVIMQLVKIVMIVGVVCAVLYAAYVLSAQMGGLDFGVHPQLNPGAVSVGPAPSPIPRAGSPTAGAVAPPPRVVPPSPTLNPAYAYPTPGNLARLAITQIDVHHYPDIAVYVSVLSPDDRPVVMLPQTGFTLMHNGVPIQDFRLTDLSARPEPLTTYLLLDTSGNMAGPPINQARTAVQTFLDVALPGDAFGLVTFSSTVRLAQDVTFSPGELSRRLPDLAARGDTALWDAVYTATQRIEREAGHRAMLLLSDGPDTASRQQTQASALVAAQRSGVPIFVVGLRTPDLDVTALQAVAQQSGGDLLITADPSELPGFYRRLAVRFEAQYRLDFTVPDAVDNAARTVNVTAGVAGNAVRGTRQYYVR